jgi:double-stranded uracil-DNA glycosylase
MTEQIVSFPPIVSIHPKILILGTMPSVTSLYANEYYAHPGNAFWKIISAIKGIDCPTIYEEKRQLLMEMDLALWDVCHSCFRSGSADSEIRKEEPNRINELLAAQESIRTILFNGQTAEKLFRRHLKTIDGVNTITLPSTSPAYTLPFEQKLKAWREIIQGKKLEADPF